MPLLNVTVFGAAGGVGARFVDQLRTGDVGGLSDAAAIDRGSGCDAVVSALGPGLDRNATGLPLVDGTLHIVTTIQRHGVRRYVGTGTPSVLDLRQRPTWQARLSTFLAKTFLRRAYDDLLGMSEIVMTSALDWTIVRFLAPRDGPAGGHLWQGFHGHDKLGFNFTRADIAAAAQVHDDRYVGAAPPSATDQQPGRAAGAGIRAPPQASQGGLSRAMPFDQAVSERRAAETRALDQRVGRFHRPALEGQDLGVDHPAVTDLDRT